MDSEEEQYGGEVGGCGEHLSIRNTPSDAKGMAERQLRVGSWRRTDRTTRHSVGQKNQGKKQELVELDLPTAGGGTEAGVQLPHQGNCLGQRKII